MNRLQISNFFDLMHHSQLTYPSNSEGSNLITQTAPDNWHAGELYYYAMNTEYHDHCGVRMENLFTDGHNLGVFQKGPITKSVSEGFGLYDDHSVVTWEESNETVLESTEPTDTENRGGLYNSADFDIHGIKDSEMPLDALTALLNPQRSTTSQNHSETSAMNYHFHGGIGFPGSSFAVQEPGHIYPSQSSLLNAMRPSPPARRYLPNWQLN